MNQIWLLDILRIVVVIQRSTMIISMDCANLITCPTLVITKIKREAQKTNGFSKRLFDLVLAFLEPWL